MTSYTNVFGGSNVPPSDYAYRAIALTADVTLSWPDNTDGTDLVAALMNVTPVGGAWTITLPAANEVSSGRDFLMRNLGAISFSVVDSAGGALATIAAGESRYFYITNNATAAGTWSVFTYGTGSSAADASALVGYGLTVLTGTLNADAPVVGYGAGITVAATDRAQLLKYTSGSGTWYLPDPTTLPNGFFVAMANAGTGTLTVDAGTNGGTVDDASTKSLQPGESMFVVCNGDSSGWFSVGYGRSTEFAFTQLSVDTSTIGVGGLTITSAQATNKLWYFYNTAPGDRTITIPGVASVYFLRIGAIGAGNELTFTTGSGSTVILTANQSYTIYCDGTNVTSAQTVAVTSSVSLDDGTAATPSISFALDADTGLYRSTTNVIGIAAAGSMVATFGVAGLTLAASLTVANGGTGRATGGVAYGLLATGTTATGAQQTLAVGATSELLVGGGAAALPVWTTATGSGAPVRGTSPTVSDPTINGTVATTGLTMPAFTGGAINGTTIPTSKTIVVTTDKLSDLSATTSAELAGVISDETGTGALVFANTPTLVTPILGTPTSGTLTNCTGLPLTTGITGTLAIGNGGTGQTTQTAAFDALSPTTTKGDLIVNDGTNDVRLPIGTDGYVFAADSVAATGTAWKPAASLGVLTLPVGADKGGTGVANNAANTITFSGNYGLTLTLSGPTGITVPTSGTVLVNSDIGVTVQAYDVDTAKLDAVQTWTANQTFNNSTVKVKGSSTGVTTLTSANSSASDYTLTMQAVTDTIAVLGTQQAFTKPQRPSLQTETAPSTNTITWDLTDDTVYQLNLNANVTTFNLTGTLASYLGYQYQLVVRYNGGTTITWNSNFKWPSGTAPTLTGTSGKIDIFNFTVCSTDGGTTCYLLNTGKTQNMGA